MLTHKANQKLLNFQRSSENHQALEPFNGCLKSVWQSLFNNEKLVCLLIMMPATRRLESVKPMDVITTFRNLRSRAGWLQYYNAA